VTPIEPHRLKPYATPAEGRLGREYPDDPDTTRTAFQRDRDRVLHTQAFRRLQGKTQVFVAGEGDHFRTRLTHTMEVAQIARDMARYLGLNEDLAETIALAHDLGHPPFGHTGEGALNIWMHSHGGNFEHNLHSLRLVTVLESYTTRFPGLNLTREVLDGLMKHGPRTTPASLEAQLVDLADEIAYTAHDCDDGLLGGIFTFAQLLEVPLARECWERAEPAGRSLRASIIDALVTDVYEMATPEKIVFSEARRRDADTLHVFMADTFYTHPQISVAVREGAKVITALCDHLLKTPTQKVLSLQERTRSDLPTAVKDYVAGMTDGFAVEQARLLGVKISDSSGEFSQAY
jgi:dGTPase